MCQPQEQRTLSTANEALVGILMTIGDVNDIFVISFRSTVITVKECAGHSGLKSQSANISWGICGLKSAVQGCGRRLDQSEFRAMAEVCCPVLVSPANAKREQVFLPAPPRHHSKRYIAACKTKIKLVREIDMLMSRKQLTQVFLHSLFALIPMFTV